MSTVTPAMGLIIPSAGDSGYPSSISATITTLDTHTHAAGSGSQIITAGITDLAVTSAKLSANAVTTSKITDLNVTRAKQAAVGQQLSSSTASFSTTSAVFVDVTNATITITTTGRPVIIMLVPDGSTVNPASIAATAPNAAKDLGQVRFAMFRDATQIGYWFLDIRSDSTTDANLVRLPPSAIMMIDPAGAGTYVYKIQAASNDGASFADVSNCKLVAYEL